MTVRIRLFALVVFCVLAPLILGAVVILPIHERAYAHKVAELQLRTAENGATLTRDFLDQIAALLNSTVGETIHWGELSDAERRKSLELVYRQRSDFFAAALYDANQKLIDDRVLRVENGDSDAAMATHPAAPARAIDEWQRAIPFAEAKTQAIAFGHTIAFDDEHAPVLPIALGVAGPGGARWTLAIGLSLRTLCTNISALRRTEDIEVSLADGATVLCPTPGTTELVRSARGRGSEMIRYHRSGADGQGEERFATVARVPIGWSVIVEQPSRVAFRATEAMRRQTLAWSALVLGVALFFGVMLARRISRPVRALSKAATQLAQGDYAYRIGSIDGSDELALLSRAFNKMSDEIEARVIERTRQLEEARDQLLQSQKISAVSALGAGMAHEINNPLTTVIGFTQLLRADAQKPGSTTNEKQQKMLSSIETEALRIRSLIQTLKSFSDEYAGESFGRCEIARVLDDAIAQADESIQQTGVRVEKRYGDAPLYVRGNATQLRELFVQLLRNAIAAMNDRPAKTLTLSVAPVQGSLVRIEVRDTGRGIAPDRLAQIFDPFYTSKETTNWRGTGLGLTVAYRIVEQHRGKIRVTSEVDVGSTFIVTLASASSGAHLV